MKAIQYTRFGPPEVLQLQEVEKPAPKKNEVLIKIHAATVASEDPGMRKSPGLNGFVKPRKPILGFYLAGEIEAVGNEVKQFKVGDQVYGNTGLGLLSAYAEYICMPEDSALVIKPEPLTFEEAVAIPNGMLTAIPFLKDEGKIQAGHKVLINGASGTVGTAAVQLAKHYGAEVTGVCSTTNVDFVTSLGADTIIDYTKDDFTQIAQSYDIIFDAVGKSSYARCKGILAENGVYLTTVPYPALFLQIIWGAVTGKKKAKFSATGMRSADEKKKDLLFANQLIEAGEIKPIVDKVYPLEQAAEAHQYVEMGHKRGDVVLTMGQRALQGEN